LPVDFGDIVGAKLVADIQAVCTKCSFSLEESVAAVEISSLIDMAEAPFLR
jgi:hypothetical protein